VRSAGQAASDQAANYGWADVSFADGGRYVVATACSLASPVSQSWVADLIPAAGGKGRMLGTVTDAVGDPDSAAAGTVRRDGELLTTGTLPARTAAVLQGYGLVSLLTAAENVEIILRAEQDAVTRELVLARLLGVAADGGALVLATHDPDVVARCDRVVSLAHHLLAPVP
jgi:hypothetical protein